MIPPPVPQPVVTKVQEMILPPVPQPVVPKVQETIQTPAVSPGELQGSSIEQIIHSIEPLIEDSVPRAQQQGESSSTVSQAVSSPMVVWPVFSPAESPAAPAYSPSPLIPAPEGKKPNYRAIGILIIAILPILAGLVIVANIMSGPSGGLAATTPVTTVVSTISTPTTTTSPGPTQVMIPPNGVWVRASYPSNYIGLIGTPGNQIEVTGTGTNFYPISTSDRIIAAVLQKKDGSSDEIILEVYKNGVMLKRESSVTPKGIVEIQLDLRGM
jgi:hypothetical protein